MSLARPQETRQLPESSRAPDVVSLGEAKDTVVLKRDSRDCCSRDGKVSATPQALLSDMCLARPLFRALVGTAWDTKLLRYYHCSQNLRTLAIERLGLAR